MNISQTSGVLTQSSNVLNSIGANQAKINSIQTQLTTNKKILDPAQQGVVTRLSSQVTGYAAAQTNIAKAQNVLNVTSTGLTSIAKLLTQMQELANKANDATMTAADAAKLNQTFQGLLTQVTSTASKSKVDSVGLLGPGSTSLDIQTGLTNVDTTTIAGVNSTASDLIPAGSTTTSGKDASGAATTLTAASGEMDISTTANAALAISALKTALDKVSINQSSVAADQLALSTVADTDASISQNLQNTIDSIQKPDAAALQLQLQEANNQQNINYYLINQMNQSAQSVLTIFR